MAQKKHLTHTFISGKAGGLRHWGEGLFSSVGLLSQSGHTSPGKDSKHELQQQLKTVNLTFVSFVWFLVLFQDLNLFKLEPGTHVLCHTNLKINNSVHILCTN